MRQAFRGYYPPTADEFEKLWSDSLIVLDTNALLNLFRYSESTRDELLELLKKEKARIWLPHQVALEFHRNRRSIPGQQVSAFQQVEKALEAAKNDVKTAIESLSRHPALEASDLSELLEKHMAKISRGLRKARKRHLKAVVEDEAHSRTFDAITDLYDGKVGPAYGAERLEEIYKEGVDRYSRKVPPGFDDQTKTENKYGDLIIWLQMLDHGTAEAKPMLFITDDGKSDWWEKAGGKTIGPRPELVEEYYAATGQRIHFYAPRRFLSYARERGEAISDATVEEARQVSVSIARGRKVADALRADGKFQTRMAEVLAAYNQQIAEFQSPQQAKIRDHLSKLDISSGAAARLADAARINEAIANWRAFGNELGPDQLSAVMRGFRQQEAERFRRLRDLGLLEDDSDDENAGGAVLPIDDESDD